METLINLKGPPRGLSGQYHDEWQTDYFDEDPWGRKLIKPILGMRCRIMQESGEFGEWSTWVVADSLVRLIKEEQDNANS